MKFPWKNLKPYPRDVERARIRRVTKRLRDIDFAWVKPDYEAERLMDYQRKLHPVFREQRVRRFQYLHDPNYTVEVLYDLGSGKAQCARLCRLFREHLEIVNLDVRRVQYRKLCKSTACPNF